MGQKVNPYGMRLGIIRESRSKWFAEGKQYRDQLVEDLRARQLIHRLHRHAAISNIIIERAAGATTVTIESAKPGIIIGRVRVNVEETKNPEVNAQLVAEEIAGQIERRASIRRAMGQAIERAMRSGADGIKVQVSGRLGGAEIARSERVGPEGRVPLHTLRADVDKGFSEAKTGYGHIGVQVVICNGEILPERRRGPSPAAAEEAHVEPQAQAEAVEVAAEGPAEMVAEPEVAPVAAEEPVVESAEEPVVEPAEAPETEPEPQPAEQAPVEQEQAVEDESPAEEDAGDVDA